MNEIKTKDKQSLMIFDELFFRDPLSFELAQKLLLTNKNARLEQALKYFWLKAKNLKLIYDHKKIEKEVMYAAQKIIWQIDNLEHRQIIKDSFSKKEKITMYKGILLTRMLDLTLKKMFLSPEITYKNKHFAGKGFRSLGQEAIYAATLRLNIGKKYKNNNSYHGDVAAPLIRGLGLFLAMSEHDIGSVINAQAGKLGAPSNGRDLHVGDFSCGVVTPAAPLAIATNTLVGLAMSFKLKKEPRVALSFIGEGGSSLGEWHEAINMACVQNLPMVFCIENNQQALSTPSFQQCKTKNFADKALGYGINSVIINGNDPEEIAASFFVAAHEARTNSSPSLIELVSMRMCGHAHHDDMLYLGYEPALNLDLPSLKKNAYAHAEKYEKWRPLDPLKTYEEKLLQENIINKAEIKNFKDSFDEQIKEALNLVKLKEWPKFNKSAENLVFSKKIIFINKNNSHENLYKFDSNGKTYLQSIELAVNDVFNKYNNSIMIGEDIAYPYGNVFMMFKNIMKKYENRFINTPISENAIVGSLAGLALGGMRPIGEIQFNDFIACAIDQVANNIAKFYFRNNINLPIVLRMPYGGLRRAGPFHSQDTSPWFYRCAGLKIMAPSSPLDAFNMLMLAADDPDPVLFYEHIALYRDPSIRQNLYKLDEKDLLCAAVIKKGEHLSIISYGAYVHKAHKAAFLIEKLSNKTVEVIDLRFLQPIDFTTCFASIKKTSRVMLCGEDSKTGSILQCLSSEFNEKLFCELDAPIKVLGSMDTPVPYSPSLEDEFLLSVETIVQEGLNIINF